VTEHWSGAAVATRWKAVVDEAFQEIDATGKVREVSMRLPDACIDDEYVNAVSVTLTRIPVTLIHPAVDPIEIPIVGRVDSAWSRQQALARSLDKGRKG
jgi:hypothetical protein